MPFDCAADIGAAEGASLPSLHLGIDLDNTIVDYEHVFAEAGVAMGLLRPGLGLSGKAMVKSHLVAQSEELWMRLQGQVYGRFIARARPYPGVQEFVAALRARGARISIVSHKTRLGHFDTERVDLWETARVWLASQGFVGGGVATLEDVHFLVSREAKIARISELRCDLFIDDLAEVLLHPQFPAATRPIWFAGSKPEAEGLGLPPYRTWAAIQAEVLSLC